MKIIKYILLIILSFLIWTALVIFGSFNGILLKPISDKSTSASFIEATKEKLEKEFAGNLAMALIEDGEVSQDFYYSRDVPLDKHSIFQMASISKWVAAWGIFTLVEDGKLDIDQPVENYLSRWHLPESPFDNSEVTIRNLLNHTSGLVDGLGYGGFDSEDSVQTIEESLTRAADAYWSEGITRVGYQPNSQYRYSGGGYTLLQLVIEEVSGQSFNDYMKEAVFTPLKMDHSSFYWSDSSSLELATFYNVDSTEAPHYRYTALAAASLYTCIEDLSLFLKANFSENPVLKKETVSMMINSGHSLHGLGPMKFGLQGLALKLSGKSGPKYRIVGHDGISRAAINNAARINTKSKNGIIIFETGSPGLASELADAWSFWKIGTPNFSVISSGFKRILVVLFLGYVIILSLFFYYYGIRRKRIQR